jgi:hypothetical protein
MPGRVDMMYVHALDPLKGWFQLSALDKSAPFDSSILGNGITVYPGRCVFCNDAGAFTADRYSNASSLPGGTITFKNTAMPMFLWAGTGDADVYNDGVALSQTAAGVSVTNWIPMMPSGVSMALVATGGYELQTTEFYASASTNYTVNAPLAAINNLYTTERGTATTVGAFTVYPNVGLLTTDAFGGGALAAYTNHIVGICSPFTQGQVNYLQPTNLSNPASTTNTAQGYNAHGMSVISFWTYFLPGTGSSGA